MLLLACVQVAETMGDKAKYLDIKREAITPQSGALFDVRGEESPGACKILDRYLKVFGFFEVNGDVKVS